MKMLWLFPGQPLQHEAALLDDPDFLALDQLCRATCGYDLIGHQPVAGQAISPHTCLQLYGVALSLYRARQLSRNGIRPDLVAEHSLGIYAALAICGCISEAEALSLTCRIGDCMSRMAAGREYALGCPIGLPVAAVEAAAEQHGVYVANYNTSRHFLLAGEKSGIEAALAACQAAGAFSVSSFACEAPLHTPLMAAISDELATIVADYRYAEPQVPLIEHITQTSLTAAKIPGFLVNELQQPVYWEQTWLALRLSGPYQVYEVGTGKALSKFNRWIDMEQAP